VATQPSYVASSAASAINDASATTIAVALGAAVQVGDEIVGMCGWDNTSTPTISVADSLGNVYTVSNDRIDDATHNQSGVTFRAKVTVAGTPTVTVTYTPSSGSRRIIVGAWRGVDRAPFDTSIGQAQQSPGTGTDAVTSTQATPFRSNALFIGFGQNIAQSPTGTGTVTAGTNYTMRLTSVAILSVEDLVQGPAAAEDGSFTISIDHSYITHVVVLLPLVEAGVIVPRIPRGPAQRFRMPRAQPIPDAPLVPVFDFAVLAAIANAGQQPANDPITVVAAGMTPPDIVTP
jgi:hypothetical protein